MPRSINRIFCYRTRHIPLILIAGSHEQKQKYLPAVASGEKLAAFAVTESSAGSDITNIKTTAVKKDNAYILNGAKQGISLASRADIYTVFAHNG